MSESLSKRTVSREEHRRLHELLHTLCVNLPTDFEPYGRRSRETDWGPDCSCSCLHFRKLEEPLGTDWGVCSNPKSPRAGREGLDWESMSEEERQRFTDKLLSRGRETS